MSAPSTEEILKALYDLAHADALEGVLPLVSGWNGPPEKPYAPHPPQLGAQIKTTCGRVYKLAEAIKHARAVLYRANTDASE